MLHKTATREAWTAEERELLKQVIARPDIKFWRDVAKHIPGRSVVACKVEGLRNRWFLTKPKPRKWPLQRKVKLAKRVEEGASYDQLEKEFGEARRCLIDAVRALRHDGLLPKTQAMRNRHHWTPDEMAKATKWYQAGTEPKDIAPKLGLTTRQVTTKLYQLGVYVGRKEPPPRIQQKIDLVWEQRDLALEVAWVPQLELRVLRSDGLRVIRTLTPGGSTWRVIEWILDGILLGAQCRQPRKDSDNGELRHQQFAEAG